MDEWSTPRRAWPARRRRRRRVKMWTAVRCGASVGSAGDTRAGDEGSRQLESTWPQQTQT